MRYILLFTLITFGMGPEMLAAQEQIFGDNPDIPPKALQEAERAYADCQNDATLSSHYECKCWSKRFLEERMRAGPAQPGYNIKVAIMGECFNVPGAAEYALKKCEGYGRHAYDGGMSFEEFCQCTSNNYAIEFETLEGQQVTRNKLNTLMTRSLLRCKTPLPGNKKIFKRLDQ